MWEILGPALVFLSLSAEPLLPLLARGSPFWCSNHTEAAQKMQRSLGEMVDMSIGNNKKLVGRCWTRVQQNAPQLQLLYAPESHGAASQMW